VPAMYIHLQAVLALYASGRTTGCVLDCGAGGTRIVPVYEGYSVPHATTSFDLGGTDMTSQLCRCLTERGYSLSTASELEIARDLKEKLAYVAQNFDHEMRAAEESSSIVTELPDGSAVTIGSERFRCAEVLFQPPPGSSSKMAGVHDAVYEAVMACDSDIRLGLVGSILLCGGSTMLPGFAGRLRTELQALFPWALVREMHVVAPADRRSSVWVGGSVLASLSVFQQLWISKAEYDESGPAIVHRKCF
jgi:actin